MHYPSLKSTRICLSEQLIHKDKATSPACWKYSTRHSKRTYNIAKQIHHAGIFQYPCSKTSDNHSWFLTLRWTRIPLDVLIMALDIQIMAKLLTHPFHQTTAHEKGSLDNCKPSQTVFRCRNGSILLASKNMSRIIQKTPHPFIEHGISRTFPPAMSVTTISMVRQYDLYGFTL